jgi:hypothetical protein
MLKNTRPLLGADMTSVERYKAIWDEIPLTTINMSRKESYAYYMRALHSLGVRDALKLSKSRWALRYVFLGSMLFLWPVSAGNYYYRAAIFGKETLPKEWTDIKAGQEAGKRLGNPVWAADGKFYRPYFHMAPPMFTMKQEDLA